MGSADKILAFAKRIASVLEDYWPSCDEAYFHGIFVDGGYSVDAFFEKDGMLLRKNLVSYFDLIDCNQPRSVDEQKVLMNELMSILKEWEEFFHNEFDTYFYAVELNMYTYEGKRRVKCHFNGNENILDDLPGGAHELHQKYFEKIQRILSAGRK